jgi:hypothetical protein
VTEWEHNGQTQEQEAVAIYKGLPHKPDSVREKTRWEKFVIWLLPWLERKRQLGDDYLEAEVLSKQAEAMTQFADAQLKLAKAGKVAAETAEIAARLDESKLGRAKVVVPEDQAVSSSPPPQLADDLAKLEQKLKEVRLKYGVRVVAVNRPENLIERTAEEAGGGGHPQS